MVHRLAKVLAATLLLSPSLFAAQEDSPASVEGLIERYRAKREAALEALRPEVEQHLTRLRDLSSDERSLGSTASVRKQLIALGSEIAPLLIQSLDPGVAQRSAYRFSQQVSLVLSELSLDAVIEQLLTMARTGSVPGQELSVRVLGESDAPERVSPTLFELYLAEGPAPRLPILTSLAKLGGPQSLAFVTARLTSEDPKEVQNAIKALGDSHSLAAADQVLSFAEDRGRAIACIQQLCAYYAACPGIFTKKHAEALLELTSSRRLSIEDRIALLDTLTQHEKQWPSDAKKTLKLMADTGHTELREAVLVALALTGDRGAKNDLLEPYEQAIAENKLWTPAYIDLADMQYRIREFRDAKKNYETALALRRFNGSRKTQVYLGLARCYALEKKYKDAEKWLTSGMSNAEIAKYATDPAFIEMAAHAKWGAVFTR